MSWPAVPWPQQATASSAELRQADLDATERFGIEPVQLMEIAGWQVARFTDAFAGGTARKRVVVVAGSGNNGGDALCAARFLHQRGAVVSASIVAARDPQSLAAHHANTARQLGIPLSDASQGIPQGADVVLDGLFGTGIRLPLREPAPLIINAINSTSATVIAIDVPSGLDADDGTGDEAAVHAGATLTLAAPKTGLARARSSGRIFLADIGMPPALFSTARAALESLYRLGDVVELLAADNPAKWASSNTAS